MQSVGMEVDQFATMSASSNADELIHASAGLLPGMCSPAFRLSQVCNPVGDACWADQWAEREALQAQSPLACPNRVEPHTIGSNMHADRTTACVGKRDYLHSHLSHQKKKLGV
eukprot:365032-Chlamydomonas_euryale.AAC.16